MGELESRAVLGDVAVAADAARFITGEALDVDGGFTAQGSLANSAGSES